MNKEHEYYVGDIITFRGVFKVEGVEQTPDTDSVKAQIWITSDQENAVVAETAGALAGNECQYQYTIPNVIGSYVLFITASFDSGIDKRTAEIEFVVLEKKAY